VVAEFTEPDEAYEIEFVGSDGSTICQLPLKPDQFVVLSWIVRLERLSSSGASFDSESPPLGKPSEGIVFAYGSGPIGGGDPLRYGRSTQQRSVALASLGLGSCRPLDGLFKSSSAAFQIEMGEVEAQKIAAHDFIGSPSHW